MTHAKGYVIRHQRRGVLTDKVYLKVPSPETFKKAVKDLGPGWTSLVPILLEGPDDLDVSALDPMDPAQTEAVHAQTRADLEIIASGTGTVTNLK